MLVALQRIEVDPGDVDRRARAGGKLREQCLLLVRTLELPGAVEGDTLEVRETGGDGLPEVSDHRPVIATFRRTPSRALSTQ